MKKTTESTRELQGAHAAVIAELTNCNGYVPEGHPLPDSKVVPGAYMLLRTHEGLMASRAVKVVEMIDGKPIESLAPEMPRKWWSEHCLTDLMRKTTESLAPELKDEVCASTALDPNIPEPVLGHRTHGVDCFFNAKIDFIDTGTAQIELPKPVIRDFSFLATNR